MCASHLLRTLAFHFLPFEMQTRATLSLENVLVPLYQELQGGDDQGGRTLPRDAAALCHLTLCFQIPDGLKTQCSEHYKKEKVFFETLKLW